MNAMTKEPETNNLSLWDSLEPTNPKYTKPFKGAGGFSGTAINGTYIIKRLTEAFGPCGTGWRFVLDDERIVEGHTLKSGDKAKLHIVRGHLEYHLPTRAAPVSPDASSSEGYGIIFQRLHEAEAKLYWSATSPQFGQTMLVGENKYGTYTDEEGPKKSITDCISKCAVLLGIGADVHLGLFDDNKYVNQRRQEVADEAKVNGKADDGADDKPATTAKEPVGDGMSPKDWARATYQAVMDQIKNAESADHVMQIWRANKDGIDNLETVSEPNFKTLKAFARERTDAFGSA